MKKYTILTVTFFCIYFGLFACNSKTKKPDTQTNENVVNSKRNTPISMTGKFIYFADGATFEDCKDGKMYDVRPKYNSLQEEKVYLELENYYLNKQNEGLAPGNPIHIFLKGHITTKESNEEGIDYIIVPTNFEEVLKENTNCP